MSLDGVVLFVVNVFPHHRYIFWTDWYDKAKIMRAYISMMVKKRCSIMSVSSAGGSWS